MKQRRPASDAERHAHRLRYCGTCKTIGRRYGQPARLTLNHDAVFLAELLSLLNQENPAAWPSALHSWNCLALPAETSQPFSLRYAAAATVFLADAKLADHQQDSPQRRWHWLRRLFSPSLRRAAQDLASYGLPLNRIQALLDSQKAREAQDGGLRDWAEPTAEVTGLFFAHGSAVAPTAMKRLGRAFGTLIYALDAWEDRVRDARSGEFNALTAACGEDVNRMRALLQDLQTETGAALNALPITEADRRRFLLNLHSSVDAKLHPELRIVSSCQSHTRRSWKAAKALAQELTARWKHPVLAPALLLPVIAIAWLAPHYARQTRSYGECLGLTLNLMVIGAALTPDAAKKKSGCSCCDACGSCDDCGDCGGCGDCCGSCACGECCGGACDGCDCS